MISAANTGSLDREGPLTHRAYTAFSVCKALQLGSAPVVHVQLRRKGVTLCGQVAEMVENFDQVDQAKRGEDTEILLGSDIFSAALEGYALLKVSGKNHGLEDLRKGLSARFGRARRSAEPVPA